MWSTRCRARSARATLIGLALATQLGGCQLPGCPLPGQTRMISLKLYFGRDIPGGGTVSEEGWSRFAAQTLTPAFPDGLTIYEALGQWRNPQDGRIVRERSFVVEAAGPVSPAKVFAVTEAYRKTFRQISVGEISEDVCAAF